jgi:hypothetical protein
MLVTPLQLSRVVFSRHGQSIVVSWLMLIKEEFAT